MRIDYSTVKLLHQSLVALSIGGFALRALGAIVEAPWWRRRWVRTVPHVVDTLLLLSGLTLAFTLRLSPLASPWFGAKLLGLVAYVVLGGVSLSPRTPRALRAAAAAAALATVGWMVTVAVTKQPGGAWA